MLLPDEYRFGATPGVMLGYKFWNAHFGGDPAAVGRTLQVGGERRTIVGVLPPEAERFPAGGADVWTALTFPPSSFLNQRGSIALAAIGRLRGDATMSAARAEMSTIAARLAAAYPDTNRDRTVRLDGLQDAMVGPIKPMIVLLALSVAMLLAVACANIANLLLAQAHARTLEFSIRGAVGASPGRLARQLWTETLGVFAVAGALGVVLAQPLASWLVSRYPETLPLAADVTIDGRVLAVAAVCTLTAALLAGFPRTRRLRDTHAGPDLRADARSSVTREHRRMTNVFVAAQVAVSIVLLFGGILLLRTFVNLTSTAPGFDRDGVITIRASIPPIPDGDAAKVVALQDRLRDAAAVAAGRDRRCTRDVHSVHTGVVGRRLPPRRHRRPGTPRSDGALLHGQSRVPRGDGDPGSARARSVGRGSRRLAARSSRQRDVCQGRIPGAGPDRPPHRMERRHVGDRRRHRRYPSRVTERPVRRRTSTCPGTRSYATTPGSCSKPPVPQSAILGELQQRVKSINPDIALTDAETMSARVAESAAPERFRAIVTGTLAGLTLLLAIVGLHGVVSYAVTLRTREIGVRLALGQRPGAVVRVVMLDTLRLITAGAVPGVLASIFAGRWLSSVVMVNADSTAVLSAVVAIFIAAAVAAAAGPAWRASHVDPIVALRVP